MVPRNVENAHEGKRRVHAGMCRPGLGAAQHEELQASDAEREYIPEAVCAFAIVQNSRSAWVAAAVLVAAVEAI